MFMLILFHLAAHKKLETIAMNVDNFDLAIRFKIFTQLGNENVHGTRSEVIIFSPDLSQGLAAAQDIVLVEGK